MLHGPTARAFGTRRLFFASSFASFAIFVVFAQASEASAKKNRLAYVASLKPRNFGGERGGTL
jgi:hypothetical protein